MLGVSPWQLLIIVVIIVILFGTKKIRSLGSDLGHALKEFKQELAKDEQSKDPTKGTSPTDATSDDNINKDPITKSEKVERK